MKHFLWIGFFILASLSTVKSVFAQTQNEIMPANPSESTDFKYIVKVLNLDEQGQEILLLQWDRLLEAMKELQAPLKTFASIKENIAHGHLRFRGVEALGAIHLAVFAGLIIEWGVGIHGRSEFRPHLRFGWRTITCDLSEDGGGTVGLTAGARMYESTSDEITPSSLPGRVKGGFIGVGGSSFVADSGYKIKDTQLGFGLGGYSSDSTLRGFGIPLLGKFLSSEAKKINQLDLELNMIESLLHQLNLAEAMNHIRRFNASVFDLEHQLLGKWATLPPQIEPTLYPASNLKRLFEPSLVQQTADKLSKGKKSCNVLVRSFGQTRPTQKLLEEK